MIDSGRKSLAGLVFLLIASFLSLTGRAAVQNGSTNMNRGPMLEKSYDQADQVPDVRFETSLDEFSVYFTPGGMILAGFSQETESNSIQPPQYFELKILLKNASSYPEITTLNPRLARNDFFGSLSPSWLTKIPNYAKVKYGNVYPDIDLLFHIDRRQLEFIFIVAPGGDSRTIRFRIEGAHNIRLTPEGALLLEIHDVTLELPKLEGYQAFDASPARSVVNVDYVLAGKNEIGLRVSQYDPRRTLIINR